MNKDELITKLRDRFHTVDSDGLHEGDTIAGITVWQIRVFENINDVLKRLTLTFYTDSKDNAFWGNSEPNPPASEPVITFADRVNVFIASKIAADTIKFGYIEQVSELTSKAWVSALMADGIVKNAVVSEDIEGNFSIEVL